MNEAEIHSDKLDATRPDDRKSPERLEQEADQARARLERTVGALSDRLSPGELLDQGMRMLRDNSGEFGRNLATQVKQNPMPLVLTAIGLSWLMFGSGAGTAASSKSQYKRPRQSMGDDTVYGDASSVVPTRTDPDDKAGLIDRVTGAATEAKDKVTGAFEATTARVHDVTIAVKGHHAKRPRAGAGNGAEHASDPRKHARRAALRGWRVGSCARSCARSDVAVH
jgi:hypothetical protein